VSCFGLLLFTVLLIGCGSRSDSGVSRMTSANQEPMLLVDDEEPGENREAYDSIEENEFFETLVNYFPYKYDEPSGELPFSVSTEIAACPWEPEHLLMRVALRGRTVDFARRKPCNLVFLMDVSGSMKSPDKLPLVKTSLEMLIGELDGDDRIAMVVYAGNSGLVLDSTPVRESHKILSALDRLYAGGSTNGGAGIELAYHVARENQDFRNDKKDAGEIGSGHTVTAFYELIPKGAEMPGKLGCPAEFIEQKHAEQN